MSWKVRRAAAKCLDAVVSTRHEMLPEFYRTVSPALIARFKEREENVKADVFHAYLSLLKQTRPAQSWLCDPDAMEQGETPLTMLQIQVEEKLLFFFFFLPRTASSYIYTDLFLAVCVFDVHFAHKLFDAQLVKMM